MSDPVDSETVGRGFNRLRSRPRLLVQTHSMAQISKNNLPFDKIAICDIIATVWNRKRRRNSRQLVMILSAPSSAAKFPGRPVKVG